MKLYHRTSATDAILKDGFKDATGSYGTNQLFSGVWLSDQPLDSNEGAWGDTLLTINMPEHEILEYEWIEEGKPYREFLIPAAIVNKYGPPTVVEKSKRRK